MRIIFLICLSCSISFSQNVLESHFVKKDKILFRLSMNDRKVYKDLMEKTLKISRIDLNNSFAGEKVLITQLRNYHPYDTLNWRKFTMKNKDRAGFAYQTLYASEQSEQKDPKKKQQQDKSLFDLLMLSCDLDIETAKACGLFFIDSTINNSNKYEYIVSAYTSSVSSKEILRVKIDASLYSENKKITDLKGTKKKRNVILQWKAKNYSSSYSGYIVERSVIGEKFFPLNKTPTILLHNINDKDKDHIFFKDTLPEKESNYSYRVRGINFFGELSDPSNTYTIANFIEPTSYPTIDSLNANSKNGIYISWTMQKKSDNDRIKKFLVLISDKDNGKYTAIHSSEKASHYFDTVTKSSTFFKVNAITFSGDTLDSYSKLAVLNDTTPPLPPAGIKATVDKKGKVTLSWNKNKEKDLQGYKILRSNALTNEMTQLNSRFITDTIYIDTLNLKTLSKKVFYALVASDQNYNSSRLSLPIEVKRPDTIKPVAPTLRSLYPVTNGVKIRFVQSSSDDVKQHLVLREEKGKTSLEVRKIISGDTATWLIDTLAELENIYSYKIIAEDLDGNTSVSEQLFIKYETGFRRKLKEFNAVADRKLKVVTLSWNYREKNTEKFIIYRKSQKIPLSIWKTVGANENGCIDNTVQMGNIYEYRIKAVFINGAESLMSDVVKVEY